MGFPQTENNLHSYTIIKRSQKRQNEMARTESQTAIEAWINQLQQKNLLQSVFAVTFTQLANGHVAS